MPDAAQPELPTPDSDGPAYRPPARRFTLAAMIHEARIKVFVVDDSPIVRDRLIGMVSELPNVAVVGQAEIAFEAINAIRKLKPDVVVLDISMPGGSGLYALEQIKREHPFCVAVMLTNFAHEQYREKCLALGAEYFFDKSGEFEKVVELLRNMASPDLQQSVLN